MINMKNPDEPLYLSAREAAGELAVSPATLYAYVSRGLVRSEPVPDLRARRYRADDVRALRNRRTPSVAAREAGPDTPVLDTSISTITEIGPIYRGAPAVALAAEGTLEQAATLLWGIDDIDPFEADNLPVLSGAMRIIAGAVEKPSPSPARWRCCRWRATATRAPSTGHGTDAHASAHASCGW